VADDRVRALEREATLSDHGGDALQAELRRLGQAFDSCDWCWGKGFRIVCARVQRCSFCQQGAPKKSDQKHIADERPRLYSGSHWRETSMRRCSAVLDALPKATTEKEARAALRNAYPFGQRKYHPYKIWCDEVRKQLARRFGVDAPAPLLERAP
jgi:hypothetical protein